MQTNNRFFDDIARVASGAMGAAAGLRSEVEGMVRDRLQRLLSDMDLVPREEFDAVKAMASKARSEQEDMALRIAALEQALARLSTQEGATTGPAAEDAVLPEA